MPTQNSKADDVRETGVFSILLRGLDVWGAYRDAVQYVTPEEVAEEFHVIVKRIARERYKLQRGGK